jgi:hypothetical protein
LGRLKRPNLEGLGRLGFNFTTFLNIFFLRSHARPPKAAPPADDSDEDNPIAIIAIIAMMNA